MTRERDVPAAEANITATPAISRGVPARRNGVFHRTRDEPLDLRSRGNITWNADCVETSVA